MTTAGTGSRGPLAHMGEQSKQSGERNEAWCV